MNKKTLKVNSKNIVLDQIITFEIKTKKGYVYTGKIPDNPPKTIKEKTKWFFLKYNYYYDQIEKDKWIYYEFKFLELHLANKEKIKIFSNENIKDLIANTAIAFNMFNIPSLKVLEEQHSNAVIEARLFFNDFIYVKNKNIEELKNSLIEYFKEQTP